MNLSALVFILIIFASLFAYGAWTDGKDREGIPADLLRATKGDKNLAKRLLANARIRYPGKSDRWYLEKILYDLERDGAGSASRKSRRSWGTITNREKIQNLFIISLALTIFNQVWGMIGGIFGGNRW